MWQGWLARCGRAKAGPKRWAGGNEVQVRAAWETENSWTWPGGPNLEGLFPGHVQDETELHGQLTACFVSRLASLAKRLLTCSTLAMASVIPSLMGWG